MSHGPRRDGLSPINCRGGSIGEAENLKTDSLKTIHTCTLHGKASFTYPQGSVRPSVKTPGLADCGTEVQRKCSTDRTGVPSLALHLGKNPTSAPRFPHG